ncbi:aberrant root formation protein 4 isoform X2 [Phoenix dactylifera]|uniref:Aberrant root formation protein 4 isoform X2 n=1 Tax=Phoenix dactylifera TaxID=42345 RepID=A0A8B7CLW6_PHODC|nr:aberrant root formation protein 4 isoform X2 [Phoenix dactylifera]
MSADASPAPGGIDLGRVHLQDPSPSPFSLRLKEALDSCSQFFETGDFGKSDTAVAAVVGLLNSIVEPPLSDSESPAPCERASEEALVEIQSFLSSPSSDQMAVDALSLELPKVVAKFAALSDRCREIAGSIIDFLVSSCSPRDMLSILCEAIDTHIRESKEQTYFILLLGGLSKVLDRTQRRHVEQVKVAIPVILKVLNVISSEPDDEDKDSLNDLFGAAISIGTSIQAICEKMVGRRQEELRAILGLYVLQNMALISKSTQSHIVSSCCSLVLQFSKFLPFCELSYFGLITGCAVASITDEVSKEDGDDFMACFSFAMSGATLAVIWGHISDEIANAAGEQLISVLNKIRNDCTVRWRAIGMFKYILSSIDYPWEIKSHGVELLLCMMEGINSEVSSDNHTDFSSFMPSLFSALQAVERIMIGTSDASLRKKAYSALKKVVSDIPSSHRFDILRALITNSNSPSMIAILIDLVKEDIPREVRPSDMSEDNDIIHRQNRNIGSPFWSSHALEIVELILKPPKGGPPPLPEHSEPEKQTAPVSSQQIHCVKFIQSGSYLYEHWSQEFKQKMRKMTLK